MDEKLKQMSTDNSHSATASNSRDLCSPVTSVAVAAGVTACLLGSGEAERLPTLAWAAVFLFLVIEYDVRTLRIPNWLNFSALAIALASSALFGGLAGLGTALGGAGLAFMLLFPAFAMGWLGAGDVKAVMVLGALWGAPVLPGLLWWMVVAGGLLAIALLTLCGGLPDLVRRWGRTLATFFFTRQIIYFAPRPGTPAAAGLPFGVAMGLGIAAHQMWGVPWA